MGLSKLWATMLPACMLFNNATAAPGIPYKYYELDTIAAVGQMGFTGFSDGISIADNGKVAFIGSIPTGQGLYVSDNTGVGAPKVLTPGFFSANRSFGRALQLSDTDSVVAVDRVSGAPPATLLRLWDQNGVFTTYARGGAANNPYDAILGFPSTNRTGAVAYGALSGAQIYLVVQTGAAAARAQIPIQSSTPRPTIADNGTVAIKMGDQPASPILLWNSTLTTPVTIASSAQFSEIGVAPGISADGKVVAFYGDITAAAARSIGTHPGPGIFVSVEISSQTRRLYRIDTRSAYPTGAQGEYEDCIPGMTCISAGIGVDLSNAFIDFAAFQPSTRVAVVAQSWPQGSAYALTVTVAFIATPKSGAPPNNAFRGGANGIFTSRLDVTLSGSTRMANAIPVMQVGDVIQGRTIKALGMNDAIASANTENTGAPRVGQPGDHRLAFWTDTSQGATIYRASYLDSDADGLPDHWETAGIDFDGNGVIDLVLPGARRFKKDLFLELDYMRTGSVSGNAYSSLPLNRALQDVVQAFAAAPVSNPLDQPSSTGIALHIDSTSPQVMVDEDIPFNSVLSMKRTPGAFNDIFDLKNGQSGTLCGSAPGTGFFGTAAQRQDANCVNIVGAKRLAYRYGAFIATFSDGNTVQKSSGIATGLPGSQFVVSLGQFNFAAGCAKPLGGETLATCGEREAESGTFMHEFGHTLGLRHGGSDNINCKPNYFSVMNYLFQFPGNVDAGRPLDYARNRGVDLNESALSETSSVGAGGLPTRFTAWSHGGPVWTGPASGPTDWSGDGQATLSSLSININLIPQISCDAQGLEPLMVQNDWDALQPDLRFINQATDAGLLPSREQSKPEITPDQVIAIRKAVDTDKDGIANFYDNCPGTYNPDQADTGNTGIGNACRPGASIAGDLNGDSIANCADLALVKAAFGKRSGQTGYDPRADLNRDGIVNILDLSAEARYMPAGAQCL